MKTDDMRIHIFLILLFLIGCLGNYLQGQGCSDAGACSIKSFRPQIQSKTENKPNRLTIGLSAGAADHSIFVFGYQFGYSRQLGRMWSFDTRIAFLMQNGNDIYASGPGDIFANINFLPSSRLSFTAGIKIPLTQGDAIYALKPLPMDYQSSLGTLDLITGISYKADSWQLVLAYQQPLIQNENKFIPFVWEVDSPLHEFQQTYGYQRKGDILMRFSYPLRLHDNLSFIPGLLPIYHLNEDEYLDTNNSYQAIEGSAGLTVNATLFFEYKLGEKSMFGLHLGFPLLVREVRPDGLTRSFVLGTEFNLAF